MSAIQRMQNYRTEGEWPKSRDLHRVSEKNIHSYYWL